MTRHDFSANLIYRSVANNECKCGCSIVAADWGKKIVDKNTMLLIDNVFSTYWTCGLRHHEKTETVISF